MRERFECVNNYLELLVLEVVDLSLGISMFISMFESFWTTRLEKIFMLKKKDVFAKFLLGTTI